MAKSNNWSDKFNPLVTKTFKLGNKEWKLVLEENKTKGTLQINLREWASATDTNPYEGPTKNGFIFQVKSIEDLDNFNNMFTDFFIEAKDML